MRGRGRNSIFRKGGSGSGRAVSLVPLDHHTHSQTRPRPLDRRTCRPTGSTSHTCPTPQSLSALAKEE